MQTKVLVFGQLAEIMGEDSLMVNDVADTDTLQKELLKRYPLLDGRKFLIAVNKQPIKSNTVLKEGSVVALLPPFSGG